MIPRRRGEALVAIAGPHWKNLVRSMCSSPATPKEVAAAAIKRLRSASSGQEESKFSSCHPAKSGANPAAVSRNPPLESPAPPQSGRIPAVASRYSNAPSKSSSSHSQRSNDPVKPVVASSSPASPQVSKSSSLRPSSSDPITRESLAPAPPRAPNPSPSSQQVVASSSFPVSPQRSTSSSRPPTSFTRKSPTPARRDHTPSYCFPSGQHPGRLKNNLYNFKYEIFKSPTRTGIFGHKVGQSRIHAPHRMARKAQNFPLAKKRNLPWEVRSLMHRREESKKKRKPNMKSNLLPIGGGDHAPNLALKLLQTASVSEMIRSVLLGSLLGHGNLFVDREKYPNAAVFYFRNDPKNKKYFDWKAEMFKDMTFEHSFGNRAEKLEFRTVPVPEFQDFHLIACPGNSIIVKRKWLNHMTPVSLAVWWCDRGGIFGGGKKGRFITDEFGKLSVETIQKYLKVMWKVETQVVTCDRPNRLWGTSRVDKCYYRLHMRTSQLKVFLRIIMGYIPVPDMIRKTVVIHDRPFQQQAWIDEMKKAMPQWTEEIDEELARQKNTRLYTRESRNRWRSLEGGNSRVDARSKRWYADRRDEKSRGATEDQGLAVNAAENGDKGTMLRRQTGASLSDRTSRTWKARRNVETKAASGKSLTRQRSVSKPYRAETKGAEITRLFNIFTNGEEDRRSKAQRSGQEKVAVAA